MIINESENNMDIIIKIEDDQISELVNKTSIELGNEYFEEALKQAFVKYIDKELDAAFKCISGTYTNHNLNTNDKDKDKDIAESVIRNLFVNKKKNYYGAIEYEPTDYMKQLVNGLDLKDTLNKYKDQLIESMHDNIDTYIATFIRNMFVSNIFMDHSFQKSLQQQIDMTIMAQVIKRNN